MRHRTPLNPAFAPKEPRHPGELTSIDRAFLRSLVRGKLLDAQAHEHQAKDGSPEEARLRDEIEALQGLLSRLETWVPVAK
jgi:hypothetical protein